MTLPSIRYSAPVLFLLPVLTVIGAFSLVALWQGRRLADGLATRVMDQAAGRVEESVGCYLRNAVTVTDHVSVLIAEGELDPTKVRSWRAAMYRQLAANPSVNSVTFGNESGDTTWMIRYPGEPGLEYAVRDAATGDKVAEYRVGERGALAGEIGTYPFDPRVRPWYRAARQAGHPTWSEPYAWVRGKGGASTLGIAYARPVTGADGRFLGALDSDISLLDVSRFLADARVSDSAESILVDHDGYLIGTSVDIGVVGAGGGRVSASEVSHPLVRDVARAVGAFAAVTAPRDFQVESGGRRYRVHVRPWQNPWGLEWRLVVIVPEDEVLAGVSELRRQTWVLGAAVALGTLLLGVLAARSLARPVMQTVAAVRRIGAGNLDEPVHIGGHREFVQLSDELNRMAAALKDHLRLRQSLALAMEIQQKLLPAGPPQVAGLDIAGHSTYCDETGGDYYDFLEIGETDSNELIVALGDVMGHGVAAALLMATARGILRSRAEEEGSLGQLLTYVNRQLVEDTGGDRFMTMILLLIDPRRRLVRSASAGHDAPILYDPGADKFVELADAGGLPLGLVPEEVYAEAKQTDLAPGQILLVATDGLWESPDPQGEAYGKDRLREVIRANAGGRAEEISAAITADLSRFRGSARQDDDITFVLVKFTGASQPPRLPSGA